MTRLKTSLLTIAVLLCSLASSAHDFEVDGIYYNITSDSDLTVSVTFQGDSYNSYFNEYSGDVVIPEKVTYSNKEYNVTSIGEYAFSGCSGELTVNCNIPSASSYKYGVFYGSKFTSVIIGDKVTSIGDYAFESCSGLTSVTIPNSVTSIGRSAFSGCSGLTSVTIGNSVTSIGERAFSVCSNLVTIKVESGNTRYDSRDNCNAIIETNTNSLIAGCKNTVIPNSVTSIGERAFSGCSGLMSVTIGNSVTSIGEGAFSGCSGLTSVTIPNSVTSIGSFAFYWCSGLTSVTIPNSVTSIGERAFYNCSGLTSIYIPESVTRISQEAFYGCSRITRIDCMAATPPLVYNKTFSSSIYSKAIIYVPLESIDLYKSADYWKEFTTIRHSGYVEVKSISFDKATVEIEEGDTMKLAVTISPEDATDKTVVWTSSDETVATVIDGVVSALKAGKVTITAMSGDVSATCEITVSAKDFVSTGAYTFIVPDITVCPTESFSLSISMENNCELTSFQCDIYIPEGVTLQKNSKGKYDITLDSERSDDHTLTIAEQEDGAIRVVAVSMTSSLFAGTEGPLLNLNLLAGEELGNYTIEVKNIKASDASSKLYTLDDCAGTIEVYYKPGDANGDGQVAVNDVVCTVNYILNIVSEDFKFQAADMTGDGEIYVNDVVSIVNTILGTSTTTAALAPRHMNAFETLSVADSRTAYGMTEFGITLSNASRYTAMQFDMELAEGADIADIKVSMPTDHSVAFRRIDDTTVRVVVTSLTNEALAEGAQLSISMKDAAGKTVAFTNGRAACNNGQMVGIMPGSTVLGGTTGIDGVNAEFAPADVYSIDGRIVKKNVTTLDGLKPGVYVVNGRKVVVEK